MILFTGELFDMFMSEDLKNCCRHIDTCKIKGTLFPERLYTVDLNIKNLKPERIIEENESLSIQKIKVNIRETL